MKQIPLTGKKGEGMYALVDDADAATVSAYSWHAHVNGNRIYPRRKWRDANGKQRHQYMHQLLVGPKVDHADRDGLNNQRSNLRVASPGQQVQNRDKSLGRWSSDYKGVFWFARANRWHATIKSDGRTRSLGYFDSEREAAEAYDDAAAVLFGEFAVLNFPDREPLPWRDKPRRRPTSQYKGVSLYVRTGRWQALIVLNGKPKYLGTFDDEIEAAKAYDVAAREAFGESAKLNFPGGP